MSAKLKSAPETPQGAKTNATELLTVKQTVERFPWLGSERALRSRMVFAKDTGLDAALRKIGARVYIDAAAFQRWVEKVIA